MKSITLKKCIIAGDVFYSGESDPIKLSFKEAISKFAPDRNLGSLSKLLSVKPGGFIGLTKTVNGVVNFLLQNLDGSGNFEWVTKKDPTFVSRIQEVYKVETIDRSGSLNEFEGKKDPTI